MNILLYADDIEIILRPLGIVLGIFVVVVLITMLGVVPITEKIQDIMYILRQKKENKIAEREKKEFRKHGIKVYEE